MNIYAGNLSLEVTAEELRQQFAAFGEVLSVSIMNDKYIGSGQTKGYAFVEMSSKSEGAAAITGLNGKRLKNRVIEIVEALPLEKSSVGSLSVKTNSPFHRKVRQRKY